MQPRDRRAPLHVQGHHRSDGAWARRWRNSRRISRKVPRRPLRSPTRSRLKWHGWANSVLRAVACPSRHRRRFGRRILGRQQARRSLCLHRRRRLAQERRTDGRARRRVRTALRRCVHREAAGQPARGKCSSTQQRSAEGTGAHVPARRKPFTRHDSRTSSSYPLTTAPALLMRDGQLIGQSMMTYTPVGGQVDVELTSAVDITVTKQEAETESHTQRRQLGRQPASIGSTSKGTSAPATSPSKPSSWKSCASSWEWSTPPDKMRRSRSSTCAKTPGILGTEFPTWWSWYGWPYGWFHLNGLGHVRWQLELPAGQEATLDYNWHYFGR